MLPVNERKSCQGTVYTCGFWNHSYSLQIVLSGVNSSIHFTSTPPQKVYKSYKLKVNTLFFYNYHRGVRYGFMSLWIQIGEEIEFHPLLFIKRISMRVSLLFIYHCNSIFDGTISIHKNYRPLWSVNAINILKCKRGKYYLEWRVGSNRFIGTGNYTYKWSIYEC